MLELTLPYPPSVNDIYGHRKNGSVYLKPKAKRYKQEVWLIAKTKKIPMFDKDKKLLLEIDMYPPTNGRHDNSNITKLTEDALMFAGIIYDDHMIYRLVVDKKETIKGGLLKIRLDVI